jgi:hypothetical protein
MFQLGDTLSPNGRMTMMAPQTRDPEDTLQTPAPEYEWAEFNLPTEFVAAGTGGSEPADAS